MKNLLYVIAILVLAAACKKNNLSPGRLSISLEDTLFNYTYSSIDSLAPRFNLDTISFTRAFRMIVKNTGQTDIRSIKFTSDNQNFEFPSAEINLLQPDYKDYAGNANTWRIPFYIIHGKKTNGSNGKVLKPGNNEATITITGEVDNGSGYTDVEIKAKLRFYAKLMDVSLFSGTSEIDLSKPPGYARYITEGCRIAYEYYYTTSPYIVKNTGNTEISLYLYRWDSWDVIPLIHTAFLHQGDTTSLLLPVDNSGHVLYLVLSSGGTATNEFRIKTGQDGNGYIGLIKSAGVTSSQ